MTMTRPFAGGDGGDQPDGATRAARARDSASIAAGQRDQLRTYGAAFVRRQVERLGAQQTDLVVEAGEIDRAAGLRQGAGDADHVRQFFGQRTDRGDRIVMFRHRTSPPIKAQRDYRTIYRGRAINRAFNPAEQTARMDPKRIGLFDLAERRLSWADRRQAVLAQNIANANTPDYKPHDLQAIRRDARRRDAVAPVRTQPNHLAGTAGGDGAERGGRSQRICNRLTATRSRWTSSS